MKNQLFRTAGACAIAVTLGVFSPAGSSAEVNVNITIPLPGPVIPAPPGLIVVPGYYVYYPPDIDIDIFFYHGYWYRPHRGGWYIASGYNGPWRSIAPRRVPGAVIELPPAYRRISPGHGPMPYGHVRRNWKSWENKHHWGKPERNRSDKYEKREHGRRDRDHHDGKKHGRGRHDD